MTKLGLCLTSLVAAIPAGLLLALLVMAFLGDASLPMMLQIFVILAMLASLVTALMPIGAFVFGPKVGGAPPKAKGKKKGKQEEEPAAEDEEFEADDEFGEDDFEDVGAEAELVDDDWETFEEDDEK